MRQIVLTGRGRRGKYAAMRSCDWDGYASGEALANAVFCGERELFNVCGEGGALFSFWTGRDGAVYGELLLPVDGKAPVRLETRGGLSREALLESLAWFEAGKGVKDLPGCWKRASGEPGWRNVLLMVLVVFLVWGLFRWIQG